MARSAKVSVDSLAGVMHGHLCSDCFSRYDDRCDTPAVDGVCGCCRFGYAPSLWRVSGRPRECCLVSCVAVRSAADRVKLRLAGSCGWWECQECFRRHPFDPKGMKL